MRKIGLLGVEFALSIMSLAIGGALVGAVGPSTFFVRVDGDDANCNGRTDAAYSAGVAPNCGFRTIQNGINNAQDGDTVKVDAGTYNESPNITKSITLQAPAARGPTTIVLQTQLPAVTSYGSLEITAPNVTVDGFTIQGFDAAGSGLASTNVYLDSTLNTISITNNRILVGAGSDGDDGIGILTTSTTDPAQLTHSLTVTGNIFTPVNAQGTRAFYVNPGVNTFTFQNRVLC